MELTTKTRPLGVRRLIKVLRDERERTLSIREFVFVFFQLGLLLLVVHQFRIEEASGFVRISPLIIGGFAIHAWLPIRLRPAFFLVLSLTVIGFTFGYPHGPMLIGIGLGLIALCHLPIPFMARVALIVAAGATLVALRVEWIQVRWTLLPTLVLPVIGAMFMFRLIIYLYDLRHEKRKASVWERLSYFFMFPNLFFLLFPVIDYQTYRRTYFDKDAFQIYQKGLLWMFRGLMQLILYRLVYHYFLPSFVDVTDLSGVAQYIVATYLLYLRISGQFHLIVGLMCLFGYNLPETHHLYFLASSFTDYWRRINIYWKDFMMKIFYYPSFMRLRQVGTTSALVLSTFIVFGCTWMLHSYQWFWLRGHFPITATDSLFWGVLGLLVVLNTLREAKHGRKRVRGRQPWTFQGALVHASKVVGMFVFISVLWSLWSSHTLDAWFSMLAAAGNGGLIQWIVALTALALAIGVGILYQYVASSSRGQALVAAYRSSGTSTILLVATLSILFLVGIPEVHGQLGTKLSTLMPPLLQDRLNVQDEQQRDRGYYEGLLNTDKFTSALLTVQPRPRDWEGAGRGSTAVRSTGDMLEYELRPSTETLVKLMPFRTNRWGMRDKDYEMEKAPTTYRIAMVGSSYAMAAGVAEEETFEALVEARLNEEQGGRDSVDQFEILNFAVGGYSLVHNVAAVRQKVLDFQPDAILLIFHTTEDGRLDSHLYSIVRGHSTADDSVLAAFIEFSGVEENMPRHEIERRLEPYLEPILKWALNAIAADARTNGVTPVAAMVPSTDEARGLHPTRSARLMQFAREAGFVVMNLEGAYGDYEPMQVRLAGHDFHPNVRGHRLLADRLYRELLANRSLIGIPLVVDSLGHGSSISQPD